MGKPCSGSAFELKGALDRAISRSRSVLAAETQEAFVALASEVIALTSPPAPTANRPSAMRSTGARLLRMTGENCPRTLAASRPIALSAGVCSIELTARDRWTQHGGRDQLAEGI